MKKLLKHIASLVAMLLLFSGVAYAATIFTVPQGGTGVGTITGILKGNGTSPFTATALTGNTTDFLNGTGAFSIPPAATPAGIDKDIQFNNAGVFGANDFFVWDDANFAMGIGTQTPITTLQVNGNMAVGNNVSFTTAIRAFNIVDPKAVMRVYRLSPDSRTAAPSVELLHSLDGGVTSDVFWDFFADTDGFGIRERGFPDHVRIEIATGGNVGIGNNFTHPTAQLDVLGSATGGVSTAALKVERGTLLTVTEKSSIENDGTHLYYTAVDGGPRYQLDQQGGVTTADNGLTVTGANVQLGGPLTQVTNIDIPSGDSFNVQEPINGNGLFITNTAGATSDQLWGGDAAGAIGGVLTIDGGGASLRSFDSGTGFSSELQLFQGVGTHNVFVDTRGEGLQYASDYSTYFATNPRSISDVAYLNAQILVAVPSQTGNSGKFLTTNGTTTSWATVAAGGVTSVSNSDSTLTISPTTGAVVASLNTSHANTWGALQTFGTNISIGGVTASGASGTGNVVFGTAPSISGATLTTSSVNGVTLTTGGSTSSFLNANGTYSTPTGAVTSVSNSDSSLTISPTTGAVVASINLANPNVFTAAQSSSIAGIATTATDGYILQNTTASTLAVPVQYSPRLRLTGTAWNSTASTSQVNDWTVENRPVTVAGTTTSALNFSSQTNAGGYGIRLSLNSVGTLSSNANATASSFQSNSTLVNSNFATLATASNTTTTSTLLFGGASTVNYRVFMNGSATSTPATTTSYGSFIIGTQAATIASTGTHALFAQQVINPLTINSGTGTLTNSASLYINGVATGATNNWGLWQPTGQVLIGPVTAGVTAENKLSIIGNANDYHGTYVANLSNGALASQDMVVGNDLTAADLTTYADYGCNSSGNTNASFTLFSASDCYLFTSGQINGLDIATGTANKPIKFGTGGTLTANERMRINDTGVVIGGTGLTTKLNVVENALAVTAADGIVIQNLTAAAAGAQQISPNIHLQGQGWKTNATAASQSVDVIENLLPVQGTANATGTLQFMASVGGSAYTTFAVITTTGTATFQGPIAGGAASSQTVAYGAAGATNFYSYNSNISTSINNAPYLFGGAANVNIRSAFGGSVSSAAVGAGNTYTNAVIASSAVTAAATGTHSIFANLVINPIGTITNTAPVTITNTTSLYVNGATTGGTNNYAMWVASGISKFDGDVKLGVAGNGLYIKEGTNATMGTCTLVLGTCTVSTTKVTANSRIFLTAQVLGTVTVGQGLAVTARSAGTSFTVTSQTATDTSTVAWMIIEPAP